MREDKGFWMAVVVGLLLLARISMAADTYEIGLLTNAQTNLLEPRFGIVVNETWTAGLLGLVYEPDLEGPDWGFGGYAKMAVDPNASIALKDWLPAIGDLIGLPETINAETYGIGRLIYTHADGDDVFGASIGAGAQVGIAVLECEYGIVEGGETADPITTSGLEIKFGAVIPF